MTGNPLRLLAGAGLLLAAGPAAAPSVYWVSSPTLANETLLIAGAGLAGAGLALCRDARCRRVVEARPREAAGWAQSVQLVLPPRISPPLFVQISEPGGGEPTAVAINAPDVWWAISGSPGTMRNGSLQVDAQHPSWINTSVILGETVRVFGRSLAWAGSTCISGAAEPGPVATTRLTVGGASATASAANCYEAAFPTTAFPTGTHSATLSTPWGEARFGLTIVAAPTPPAPTRIDVAKDFGSDLGKALAHAATLPAVPKVVALGAATYQLESGVSIPPNTTLLGSGAGATTLAFTLGAPKPGGECGATVGGRDFFKKGCDPSQEHCFRDVKEYDNTSASLQDCCDKCKANPSCNGYTHEYDPRRGYLCLLKACTSAGDWAQDCETSKGGTNNSCAYVTRPTPPGGLSSSAITVASDVALLNFSLHLTPETTVPQLPAVFVPPTSRRFRALGLRIQMDQQNVSNAFKIFGSQFELGENEVHQAGPCLWPGYGPLSDATPFQPSVTLYMSKAVDGWVHHNDFYWRCSMMDLDVSDRVIFEDNTITMTEPGIPPHGNSISGYAYAAHPSSRWWSYARNRMSRPPSSYAEKQIWTQRETLTTDGSGWWASGHAVSVTASGALVLDENMTAAIAAKGGSVLTNGRAMLTLKILGCGAGTDHGCGTGQTRLVTGWDNATRTLTLESPLDRYFSPAHSIIAIVGSFGAKAFVGNTFNWTEVKDFCLILEAFFDDF